MDPIQQLLLSTPGLLLAFCCHEFAHAWVAVREGDDTPLLQGRVTLDPRAHLDPIGSILFPVIARLTGAPLLGWARPVLTNTRKYRDYRGGDIRVSLAGVTANLILAVVMGVIAAALLPYWVDGPGDLISILGLICYFGTAVNVGLMFFNRLPIPPLDGSHVLYHYLPAKAGAQLRAMQPYGFIILYALLLTGLLGAFFGPVVLGITEALIRIPASVFYG